MRFFLLIFTPLLLFFTNPLFASDIFIDKAEVETIKSLELASQQQWQAAQQQAQKVVKNYPSFKAGKRLLELVRQHLLPDRPNAPLIKPWTNEYTKDNLDAELTKRWRFSKINIQRFKKPASIIQLATDIKHVIVIETDSSRAFLFRNNHGQPDYMGSFYAAIGKLSIGKDKKGKQKSGDHLTPIGIYTIDGHRADNVLQEIYGVGALTLNYPNAYDKKLKRTGNGIWLHGVPRNTYSRPPHSSRGCVTMSNGIFTKLSPYTETNKTPVILTEKIHWVNKGINNNLIKTTLAQWQADWESRDTNKYFAHYHQQFGKNKQTAQKWRQHKKNINQAKTYIKLQLNNLSLFQHPSDKDIVVSQFQQNYESNNFSSKSNKEIIWKKTTGNYKIFIEQRI